MIMLSAMAVAMTIGAAPPETYPVHGDTGHVCNAAKAKTLVGRKRSPAVEAQALHLTGAGSVRWIRPGMMVTMDYRPDRLNLRVDGKGKILSANCG